MIHPSKRIGSVQRAIDILDLFSSACPELGTSEIARRLGLHKSTAASLMYTLEANGYLAQDPQSRKYRLGMQLLNRSAVVLNHLDIRRAALPYVEALRAEFDETVNLGVPDGSQIIYIERQLSSRPLGMRSEVGKRSLLHSTAMGKALLSYWPLEQVAAFIERYGLPALTAHTIGEPDVLFRALAETRALGYGFDDEENEEGGRCVAAAIFDHQGRPAAAISLSVPTLRLPYDRVPQLGRRVAAVADAISRNLGYVPAPVTVEA